MTTDREQEIRREHRHALGTRPTPADSWLNGYRQDVGELLAALDAERVLRQQAEQEAVEAEDRAGERSLQLTLEMKRADQAERVLGECIRRRKAHLPWLEIARAALAGVAARDLIPEGAIILTREEAEQVRRSLVAKEQSVETLHAALALLAGEGEPT